MEEQFQDVKFVGPAEYLVFLSCLLAMREERSNGSDGVKAVLFVLRNRVKAGFHDGDLFENIVHHGEFSSMSIPGDSQTVWYPHPNDPMFKNLLSWGPYILAGQIPDKTTAGALYYADFTSPYYDKNGWFAKNIVSNTGRFPRVAVIGSTTYFGDKEAKLS